MPGTLFVVATPIGNLADASPRALEVLREADLIACEDTRTSRTLLARYGIGTKTVSLHEHNERTAAGRLLDLMKDGKHVALISDAGTPALSDPGALLVAEAHRAGIPVSPIPGPNAAATAFSASGFAADRFLFAGFLPASASARRKALEDLEVAYPVVLYEAPHRVVETVQDLLGRFGAEREIVFARELTKKFEEVARMRLGDAVAWVKERAQGEFVLVLSAGSPEEAHTPDADKAISALLEVMSPSDAAKLAAKITGLPRRELYRRALERAKCGK